MLLRKYKLIGMNTAHLDAPIYGLSHQNLEDNKVLFTMNFTLKR